MKGLYEKNEAELLDQIKIAILTGSTTLAHVYYEEIVRLKILRGATVEEVQNFHLSYGSALEIPHNATLN